MAWPSSAVDTTDTDSDTDSPVSARQDLLDGIQKLNQIIAHVTTQAQQLLDDASFATMRQTLGSGTVGDAIFIAATKAAAQAALGGANAYYAPHAETSPSALKVVVDTGAMFVNGALVANAAQTVTLATAHATLGRIDHVVIDAITGVASKIDGTAAASPAAPAITAGKLPVAQVLVTATMTVVTNSAITDERAVINNNESTLIDNLITSNWIERSNQLNVGLNDVAWNDATLCAVGMPTGGNAYIVTSTTGMLWSTRTNPKNFSLLGICWNGTVFCAVGNLDGTDAYVVTSPTGVTWTERANPKNVILFSVASNGSGLLCAVGGPDGADAYIITSADNGVTWTERANPKNVTLNSIVWNGTVFCAVGAADGTDAYIVTSPDGITWTERSNPQNVALSGVCWNGAMFCAVGDSAGAYAYIVTSPDGITWTQRANPRNLALYDVEWNGSVFCAVGESNIFGAYITTSPDGIAWTSRTNQKDAALSAIVWVDLLGGCFCAVGPGDGTDAYIVNSLMRPT